MAASSSSLTTSAVTLHGEAIVPGDRHRPAQLLSLAHRSVERAARAADDDRLVARIRVVHRRTACIYAVLGVTAQLRDTGHWSTTTASPRSMRGIGPSGLRLRRRHRTTIGDPAAAKTPDLLDRDFAAEAPNTRYVGHITYLPIADGTFCYVATVMHLCSRLLVGRAIADHMRTDLVTNPLAAA